MTVARTPRRLDPATVRGERLPFVGGAAFPKDPLP